MKYMNKGVGKVLSTPNKKAASVLPIHFLSVKINAYFLRSTLSALVIFYIFQKFYNLRKYIRVMKDSGHPFLVSLSTAFYIVDITCACLKLGAKAAPQTVKPTHDII